MKIVGYVLKGIGCGLLVALLGFFLFPIEIQTAHAQIYADPGVSNVGSGWVIGQQIRNATNSAGTNWYTTTNVFPLGFFGHPSTNRQSVPNVSVTNALSMLLTNVDTVNQQTNIFTAVTNMTAAAFQAQINSNAAAINAIVNLLKAYGLANK